MLDPDKAYISISQTAGEALRAMGLTDATTGADIHKTILGAITCGCEIMESTKELHFMAETTIGTRPVFLLCVTRTGSPANKQPFTTIIRGVLSESQGEDILLRNKGLTGTGLKAGRALANAWKKTTSE